MVSDAGAIEHAKRVSRPYLTKEQRERERREALLTRVGLRPSANEIVQSFLDRSLPATNAVALDAGCGRWSELSRFRPRLAELVGVDVHAPPKRLSWLDRFVVADVCAGTGPIPPESFDLVLSSFTIEHFADPATAMRTMAAWLRPGGWVVVSTVNRRNPLVNAYLSMPRALARRLQPMIKATPADAHPLVGACNDPEKLRATFEEAGLRDVEIVMVDHLARAWRRRTASFAVGLVADLVFHRIPSRRSTIVARARRPD
jgi:SAM-dependent methyltransferase